MKRALMLVIAFAAVAVGAEGTYMPTGSYGFFFGTPEQVEDPAFNWQFSCLKGPPRTLTSNGVVYTWDSDDEVYRAPDGDTWQFDGLGRATFTDWPTPPLCGPGVPTTGLVY